MKPASILLIALTPLFFACNSEEPTGDAPEKQPATEQPKDPAADSGAQPAATPAPPPAALDEPASPPKVRLETNHGNIVIQLDPDKAPITVKNFLGYVERKHFDGTVFHRVIADFMIQGGGFALNGNSLVEKKTGPGIKNEGNNGLKNLRGTIAMARTPNPDSATAQFFINLKENSALDHDFPEGDGHGYAVFGKVVEGMDVVDTIRKVPTSTQTLTMLHPVTGQPMTQQAPDVPQQPIVITRAVVVGSE
jgi:cyclophilin family peptidyl-prolyl cis-trans isomerase